MDILSHGLWGSIAFGRRNRKSFWLAFFFGVAPDLFSFGVYTILAIFGVYQSNRDWSGPPPIDSIPQFVHSAYDVTHSLVVFAIVFAVVWLIRKRPLWELSAWALHILVDLPTHSTKFFPTPIFWPISDFRFDGHPWSDPRIFIPNVVLLVILYSWFFLLRPYLRKRRLGDGQNQ